MDHNTLKELLDRENVDPRSYAFDSPNPEEQYCLQQTSEGWVVYYAERGLLREVDAEARMDTVTERMLAALGDAV